MGLRFLAAPSRPKDLASTRMSFQYNQSEIIQALESGWIETVCGISACALITYDHLSTLSREVNLIWSQKLSSVTILFHINRWVIFMWGILNVVDDSLPLGTIPSCVGLSDLGCMFELILGTVWAVFSAIRLYAVSGGNIPLAAVVLLLDIVPVGLDAYSYFGATWYAITGAECYDGLTISQSTNSKFAISAGVASVAADIIVLVVTWLKTYGIRRQSARHGIQSPLTTLLIQDGTGLLLLNILNIVGQTTNAFVYAASFSTPLTSFIITHFFLNLRQVAHETGTDSLERTSPRHIPQSNAIDSPRLSEVLENRSAMGSRTLISMTIKWISTKRSRRSTI
ncbi:hypothetical protein CERSUDRAFT_67814 [Gelatoporia subvermispora B]|uniref:DUF6533 domain-containing protein n=1 Tax=Ceriporiopsis subvermispora (strain B) TaxID=914234 RepID=M2R3Y4_CERS8|nr:hypothetical protein CERSUDRAFT_67814 [Gelatoporia subvermispora B]